jgi:GNAT superfamily N-acetyltransferase
MSVDAEACARRDARRLALVLRELASDGAPIAGGWMACDAEGSWAEFAAGLGLQGPVSSEEIEALVAFYAARGRPAKVQTVDVQHPSLVQGLLAQGFYCFEAEQVLTLALDRYDPGPTPHVAGLRLRQVDPAQPDDVAAFVAVQLAGFFPDHDAPEGMRPITERTARHPRGTFWLAELDGEVVGSAGLEVFEGSAVLIAGAVVPQAQRRGIQRAMLHHRLAEARRRGFEVALIASLAGGPTERNALRVGFSPAYTAQIWRLDVTTPSARPEP